MINSRTFPPLAVAGDVHEEAVKHVEEEAGGHQLRHVFLHLLGNAWDKGTIDLL